MTDTFFRAVSIAGLYDGIEISQPSDPVIVRVALPYSCAGRIVTEAASLHGKEQQPPFALLVLGSGQDRSVAEEVEAATMAALTTLAVSLDPGLLRKPFLGHLARTLSSLAEQAKTQAESSDQHLQ